MITLPYNNDALARIINTPSRRIGETTIKSLLEEAEQSKLTLWALILNSVQGRRTIKTKLTTSVEKSLSIFVDLILTGVKKVADASNRENSIVKIMEFIIERISYEKWLESHHGDAHKARWDNVKELITQASDFQGLISSGYEDESLPQIDGLEQEDASDPLSRFLANVALASEVRKEEGQESSTPQITLSTIHAAKGLEWPIVFIPGAYQGSIPHSRAEDTDEERRLLYVAMTRAKALLYMSCPLKSSLGELTVTCPFLSDPRLRAHLDRKGPSLRSDTVQCLAQILRRSFPSKDSIALSSACLELTEDTYYPLEAEDDKSEESKWNLGDGNPTFTVGQRPLKRRRADTAEQTGNVSRVIYSNTSATTMERSSNFTMSGGFVSAAAHLHVLDKKPSNLPISESKPTSTMGKFKSSKSSSKGQPNSQSTLLGFLGKQEPRKDIKTVPIVHEFQEERIRPNVQLHRHRNTVMSQDGDETLPPLLTGHRIGAGGALSRPNITRVQEKQEDSYVFLSSSPPKGKRPIGPESNVPAPGLTAKPAIMSLVRPARTLHTTSMAMAQGSSSSKRTLGTRRSVNGWSNGSKPFIPPSRKRDN